MNILPLENSTSRDRYEVYSKAYNPHLRRKCLNKKFLKGSRIGQLKIFNVKFLNQLCYFGSKSSNSTSE